MQTKPFLCVLFSILLIFTSTAASLPPQQEQSDISPIMLLAESHLSQNNTSPTIPTNPTPANQSINTSVVPLLEWDSGDPDQNNTVTYGIYLGNSTPPPLITTIGPYPANQAHLTYQAGPLTRNTTYYWHIIAEDNKQNTTTGPLWQFTTTNYTRDTPPPPPRITGPTTGGITIAYNFTFIAIDPDGDDVSYKIDWGDGNSTDWLGPYTTTTPVTIPYAYNLTGTYNITALTQDSDQLQSNRSTPYLITIQQHIAFANYKPGRIYFRFLSFNESFLFIPFLEYIKISLILGNIDLIIKATPRTTHVDTVIFEAYNQLANITIQITDDNRSDGYSAFFNETPSGIYKLSLYAYNNENLLLDNPNYTLFYLNIGATSPSATPSKLIQSRFS